MKLKISNYEDFNKLVPDSVSYLLQLSEIIKERHPSVVRIEHNEDVCYFVLDISCEEPDVVSYTWTKLVEKFDDSLYNVNSKL